MPVNNNAFTYSIDPIGSGTGEHNSIHQTSPAWVLTFLRWQVRDTLRTEPTDALTSTTISQPMVIENDCISMGVSDSKAVLTPSLNVTLKITDVNYETAIAPGDFVMANMLNWEADARRVANQARALQPINGPLDGFKGLFKIQSARKVLITDPETGTKIFAVKITAYAFTEFNNVIYFNPYLIDQAQQNIILFSSLIGTDWQLLVAKKGLINVQDVMTALITSFIGAGLTDAGTKGVVENVTTENVHYFMPTSVGNLLGVDGLTSAKDAFNYLFGIQTYSAGASQSLAQGMNPSGISPDATDTSRFMYVPGKPLEGNIISKPDYWNQVKVWDILKQFVNSPLNELYTCFRISPNGSVMPTVVFRQIPFTTDDFVPGDYNVTTFMNVPRWKINTALALDLDLGRDEAARINFVQYFGRSTIGPDGYSISEEIAQGNYLYDKDDVVRNGLRPYVVSSQFDEPLPDSASKAVFRSPGWAKIVGDALIGGHLKFNGTIHFAGIEDPIAVGDNLQFDNVVYHIEQITHTCEQQPGGKKSFRTTVMLSNGVSIYSGANGLRYPEMRYGSAYDQRKADYNSSNILPGISESQDTIYRNAPINPDTPRSNSSSFVQPDTNTAINKTTRDT